MDEETRNAFSQVNQKLDKICECLYGDGNPGEGLTDRLSVLETQQKWIIKIALGVVLFLLGLLGVREISGLF